jgi:hypothetical protein
VSRRTHSRCCLPRTAITYTNTTSPPPPHHRTTAPPHHHTTAPLHNRRQFAWEHVEGVGEGQRKGDTSGSATLKEMDEMHSNGTA